MKPWKEENPDIYRKQQLSTQITKLRRQMAREPENLDLKDKFTKLMDERKALK